MNSAVGDAYTDELVKLFQQQGSSLYEGQHSLCLTTPCLHFLQRRFSAIQEASTDPVPAKFAMLEHLQDSLAKIVSLKLIADKQLPLPPTATLNLEPFKALHTLTLKKVSIQSVIGLQRLRSQLKVLIIQRCQVENIQDVIVRCGGDDSTSFAWNSLKELDLSNNNITKLGDSLQYLPCLEKVNFSNNYIGTDGRHSAPPIVPPDRTSITGGQSPATEVQSTQNGGVASGSSGSITDSSEGIVCIENVTFLHLGFNKLKSIPRFATKAKYNLTVLNLRNNELEDIEGLHELDSLVELDLTDNLLTKHSCLSPLMNLHHLSVLTLQGNPLSFHHKHRLKTAANLSNLIIRNTFRLEGKKLTATEKKVISSSLTHYPGSTTPTSSPLPLTSPDCPQTVVVNRTINNTTEDNERPVTTPGPAERFAKAISAESPAQENVGKKSRKKKGGHTKIAKIVDSEEEDDLAERVHHKSKEDLTVGSVPLIHEKHLNKIEQVRKQLEDDWIKTINSVDSSSTTTETSTSQSLTVSSQNSSQTSSQINSLKPTTVTKSKTSIPISPKRQDGTKRERRSRGKRRKGVIGEGVCEEEDVMREECEGVFGPRTSSPDRGPTPNNIGGDCFLVERYESDVEDDDRLHKSKRGKTDVSSSYPLSSEGRNVSWAYPTMHNDSKDGGNQVMIVLTERFLEEKSSKGKLIDRWDLHSLQAASIDKRPWKKGKDHQTNMSNVLFLKFNLDRRDRRRREYVLLEDGVNESLLGILIPIIEQNQATLSVENKLECLHCQRIFDKFQALDEPSEDPQPLPLGSHMNRSLSKLMCPYCHSQVLQYSSSGSKPFKPGLSTSLTPSPRLDPPMTTGTANGAAANSDSFHNIITSSNQAKSGFDITEVSENHHNSEPHSTAVDIDPAPRDMDIDKELAMDDTYTMMKTGREGNIRDTFIFLHTENEEEFLAFDQSVLETRSNDGSYTKTMSGDSDHERDLWTGESNRKELPEEDNLSPWKTQKKKEKVISHQEIVGSRPRAGAIRDMGEEASSLLESFEKHKELHETVAKKEEAIPISSNPFDEPQLNDDHKSPSKNTQRDNYYDDVVNRLPELEMSMSVPSDSKIHTYMGGLSSTVATKPLPENTGHNRSKSVDCHPRRVLNVTPPSVRKKYADPYVSSDDGHIHSLGSLKEGESFVNDHHTHSSKASSGSNSHSSSRKSSVLSLDDRDSPRNSKHDVDWTARGYSSSEARQRSKRGSYDKCCSSGEVSNILSRGYTSSEGTSRQRNTTGSIMPRVRSHGDIHGSPKASRKQASDSSRKNDRSRFDFLLGGSKKSTNAHSSSDGAEKRPQSSLTLYKDDDPTYIESNLNLYLDMDVFNLDKKEEFRLVFRTPVIQYGHSKEMPSLVVVSNLAVYIFRITAPENSTPSKWLELIASHLLRRLVFIDIGVGYQFLRVEFRVQSACYTFMVRDEDKCTAISTKLAFIVSDVPRSSFKTVGVCPFSLDSIRYPKRALKEVMMVSYEKLSGRRTPTKGLSSRPGSSLGRSPDDDDLLLYRLAHKRASNRSQVSGPLPVTLVLTKSNIYLAKENFSHWPLPRIQDLPARDTLQPPYSDVQQRDVTDIEKIVLDRDQTTQITIRFFKENVPEREDRYWCLIMHTAACVDKLVASIKTPWESSFQTDLPIIHK